MKENKPTFLLFFGKQDTQPTLYSVLFTPEQNQGHSSSQLIILFYRMLLLYCV